MSLRLHTRSEKSFPAKLSNETTFKMDSILICSYFHSFVGRSKGTLLISGQQLAEGLDSTPRYTRISSVNIKQILRRYEQWHILRHISLPLDDKTIKKTGKSTFLYADGGSFTKE